MMKMHSELTKYFNRNNKPQSDPLLKKTDRIQDGHHNSTCTYANNMSKNVEIFQRKLYCLE